MKRIVLVVLCGIVLGVAAPAMADSGPTQGAYSGSGATQLSQVQNTSTSKASTLPFTGINVGVIVVIAVVLAGSGLILRRRTSSDQS